MIPFDASTLFAEYGEEVWTAVGARTYLRPDRPPQYATRAAYRTAVRRRYPELHSPARGHAPACSRYGCGAVPGAVLAAAWRVLPPSEWRAGGRAEEWVAYWTSHNGGLRVTQSPYQTDPADICRAWALGLTRLLHREGADGRRHHGPEGTDGRTHRGPGGLARLAHLLPARWTGGRRRARATLRLSRAVREFGNGEWGPQLPPGLATSDLRRLARLSGAALRAVVDRGPLPTLPPAPGGRVRPDWAEIARRLRRLAPWRARLQEAHVSAHEWAETLDRAEEIGEILRRGPRALRAWDLAKMASLPLFGEVVIDDLTREQWARAMAQAEAAGTLRDRREERRSGRTDPIVGRGRRRLAERRVAARRAQEEALRTQRAAREAAREAAKVAALRERNAARVSRLMARRSADGRIVGWRGWAMEESVLLSPHFRTRWEHRVLRTEPPVGRGCRNAWGIHAAWSRRGDVAGCVLGRVLASGTVVSGPEGWRAEEVEIDCLLVPRGSPESLIEALRTRYGVRVGVFRASSR